MDSLMSIIRAYTITYIPVYCAVQRGVFSQGMLHARVVVLTKPGKILDSMGKYCLISLLNSEHKIDCKEIE